MIEMLLGASLCGQVGYSPMSLTSWEYQLVEATNVERARYNLRPLTVDPGLQHSARWHAQSMAANGYRHSGRPGEIIASGENTVGWVMRDWMESPSHRANILDPDYQKVGAATVRHPKGYRLWVQQYE